MLPNGVYGGGYGGGWQSSQQVVLPLQPAQQQPLECCGTRVRSWRMFGIVLSLLAAASLALGIADVVVTYQNYMVNQGCASATATTTGVCSLNLLVFTWIAPGIWGSLVPFIVGLMAIRKAHMKAVGSPEHMKMCFEAHLFLAAFVFTPAMIVLSAIEVFQQWPVFYAVPYNDMTKVSLPIAIAVLGFLEHLMVMWALIYVCCCRVHKQTVVASPPFEQPTATLNAAELPYSRPRTQIFPASSQLYPASYGVSPSAATTSFPGAIYGGFGARPLASYNYFLQSNVGTSAVTKPNQFMTATSPNAAYSYYYSR